MAETLQQVREEIVRTEERRQRAKKAGDNEAFMSAFNEVIALREKEVLLMQEAEGASRAVNAIKPGDSYGDNVYMPAFTRLWNGIFGDGDAEIRKVGGKKMN